MVSPLATTLKQPPRLDTDVWRLLEEVPDPEIRVLSVVELGIIRYACSIGEKEAEIGVPPTYTGCPATEVIHRSAQEHLGAAGLTVSVRYLLAPALSRDWIAESAREKLRAYGIAPPAHAVNSPKELLGTLPFECPRCASRHTRRVSEFGSTPCKALHRCEDRLEPFEYFKCIEGR